MAAPATNVGDTRAGRRAWLWCAHQQEVGRISQPALKRNGAVGIQLLPTLRVHIRVDVGARAAPELLESARDVAFRDLVSVVVCFDLGLCLATLKENLRMQGRP